MRKTVEELRDLAKTLRKTAVTMIYDAKAGHPGGSLSAADIVAALYFGEMNISPEEPRWPDRDRFVLSKGHTCPIQYSALALTGFIPMEDLKTLRQFGSKLQGHPSMNRCPGVDISTGSLGQGIAVANGMALAGKRDGKKYRTFVIVGDGECQEGQVWEAAEIAAKYELDNLIVFVDNNGLQNDGACRDIMPTQDLRAKFEAFGWEAYRINGHCMEEIVWALDHVRGSNNGKPKAIVCNTVKGKSVSFMENVPIWHGLAPNDEQYKIAMEDIERGF